MRHATSLALAAVLAAAPALSAPRAPGLRPDPASAEAGLWGLLDDTEQEAKQSAELNTDPALSAYVSAVACKVAAEYCADLRIYVLDRPFANATMAPNGYGEVWSGLLLRMQNEAEFAYVLGHEASHFAENHSLEAHEKDKNGANASLALSIGLMVVGATVAMNSASLDGARAIMEGTGDLIDAVYLGRVAGLFAFSRENESEADVLGLQRAVAAGYRPSAAPATWRNLMDEAKASDFEEIRRSDSRLGVFDSHPLNATRVAALETEIAALPQTGELGAQRHRAAIRPHLARWLRDDLRRRDFGQTLHVLDRLGRSGEDLGVINFYRGEAYRLRRGPADLLMAKQAYEAATPHSDAPPAVWRELGDIRARDGDRAGARLAYESYLQKASTAEDAWLVQDSLKTLTQGN